MRSLRWGPFALLLWTGLCVACSPKHLTEPQARARLALKRAVYGPMAFRHAVDVAAGAAEPHLLVQPRNLLLVNWTIPAGQVAALEQRIGLAPDLHLAPIAIVQGEQPRHFLTVMVYEASIAAVEAATAEWCLYVRKDGEAATRMLIADAWSSGPSFDPVHVQREPSAVSYGLDDTEIRIRVERDGGAFEATLALPEAANHSMAAPSRAWVLANDEVHWRNGVADTVRYDGRLTDAQWLRLDTASGSFTHQDAAWRPTVDHPPHSAFVFAAPVQMVVSAWSNLDETLPAVDDEHLQRLRRTKASVFGGLAFLDAICVYAGTCDALLEQERGVGAPGYFVSFALSSLQVAFLSEAIASLPGLALAKTRVHPTAEPEYLLTLHVYGASGVSEGLHADWLVYVTDDARGDVVYRMRIHGHRDRASADVVTLRKAPADLFVHRVDGDTIETVIIDDGMVLSVRVPLADPQAEPAEPDGAWVRSQDRVYRLNGVYDKYFYNGPWSRGRLFSVAPDQVQVHVHTPWPISAHLAAIDALVSATPVKLLVQPWYNLGR